MKFNQNEITEKFIQLVKVLVNSGKAGSVKDVARTIDYSYSALNQIMNGGRNVPATVYKKFMEVYKPGEIKGNGTALQIAVQNQAIARVLLRALAEVLSNQRNEPVTKTLGDLEAAVRVEVQEVVGRL
jgi:hypothetical protein